MSNIFSSFARRSRRRKVYADLLKLDDHLLRDIGINRSDLHVVMRGRGKVTSLYE